MMTLNTAIEKAFNTANLIGDGVDLWEIMFRYKVIRELPSDYQDKIYDDLASRLGF